MRQRTAEQGRRLTLAVGDAGQVAVGVVRELPPISRGYCGFARKCARRFRAQHASVFSWHTGHSSP
jgi:hypothetical protein